MHHSEELDLDTATLESTAQVLAGVVRRFPGVSAVGVGLPASVEPHGVLHATRDARLARWREPGSTPDPAHRSRLRHHQRHRRVDPVPALVRCRTWPDPVRRGHVRVGGRLRRRGGRFTAAGASGRRDHSGAPLAARRSRLRRRPVDGFRGRSSGSPHGPEDDVRGGAGGGGRPTRRRGCRTGDRMAGAGRRDRLRPGADPRDGRGHRFARGVIGCGQRGARVGLARGPRRCPELVLPPLDFRDFARGAAVAAIRLRFTAPA